MASESDRVLAAGSTQLLLQTTVPCSPGAKTRTGNADWVTRTTFYRLFVSPACWNQTCEFLMLLQALRTPVAHPKQVSCFLLVEVTKASSDWVMTGVCLREYRFRMCCSHFFHQVASCPAVLTSHQIRVLMYSLCMSLAEAITVFPSITKVLCSLGVAVLMANWVMETVTLDMSPLELPRWKVPRCF